MIDWEFLHVFLIQFDLMIQGDWSLSQGEQIVMFDVASKPRFLFTSTGTSWLGIRCIANDHVTVNEDKRLINKLEGF